MKKILYIDMDNVLVDFQSGIDQLDKKVHDEFMQDLDEVPHIFSLMKPMPGAIAAVTELAAHFDLYILSTAPWKNPTAWIDKLNWIHTHFGNEAESILHKRLIISHHKNLNRGDFLIDDRPNNGAKDFEGEWICFGSPAYPDWKTTTAYLLEKIGR